MFSDQPIKKSENDLFGRKEFSYRIAKIIADRKEKESIVIGVHAPWGEGKTSVLNMIIEGLDEYLHKENKTLLNGHIILLKFNPWRFSDENQLLENFFYALADKLEGRIETKGEKLAELVRRYSWVSTPLEAIKLNLFGVVDAKFEVEKTLTKLADAKPKADMNTLKERIETILNESDKKIIVIMDDIDRLDKEEVQAIFRLIKLTADFPNTIYILSCDIDRVAEALADKYGSREAGKAFLEKIIQLSLPLPPLTSNKLIKLAFENINKLLGDNRIELPKKEDQEWSYFFITTFGSYLKSPRLVKKYINNLWFSMPETKDELNIFDLQTIEAVRIFFPKLYDIIRSNKNVFLMESSNPFRKEQEEKEHIEKLKKIIESFPEAESEGIKNILRNLFPRTIRAFSNSSYGSKWYETWTKEKRITSPQYFQRYFDLGVSSDDISDIELKQFIEKLTSRSDNENVAMLEVLISHNREELFLQKISLLINSLKEDTLIKLARAIVILGNLFPKGNNDALLLGLTPFSHAAYLLRDILLKVTDREHREAIAVELAELIYPLDFAYEYFNYLQYVGKENEDELPKIGKAVISKIVERIEIEVKEDNLERRYPQYSSNLYRAWLLEKPNSAKKYLEDRLKKNPQEAEDFILSFSKQAWDVNGVAKLFGFDFVISAIEKLHSDIEILPLENYTENSNYLPKDQKAYLIYFVSIAKKRLSEIKYQ